MEREKEIFLEEEREQKLKDRQVFVNLTRDRPKEIVETEIIDKTIPSPDTKRKDEERYKGHLRDSLLDEAQSEWEEKMQKRKDYVLSVTGGNTRVKLVGYEGEIAHCVWTGIVCRISSSSFSDRKTF